MRRSDRIVRYATKTSSGAGEIRRLHVLPKSGEVCAREYGFNLVGPAMYAGDLSDADFAELLDLAAIPGATITAEQNDRLREITATLPRITCVGIDIDGDDVAASNALAEIIQARFEDLGYALAAYHSSGKDGAGLHLEFGGVAYDAARPDVGRPLMRLVADMAEKAGLVPVSGSRKGQGYFLSWCFPGHEKAPGAKIDLIPFNHDPASKGRLFRPIGGLNKTRTARKCATRWNKTQAPSMIDSRLLRMAPPPIDVAPKKRSKIDKNFAFEPITIPKDAKLDYVLKPLIEALESIKRPGENHQIRMAICGLAQSKSILDRKSWLYAMNVALPDASDAAEAFKLWETTKQRIRLKQPYMGAGALRRIAGSMAVDRIIFALSKITGETLPDVKARFGRATIAYQSDRIAGVKIRLEDMRKLETEDKRKIRIDRQIRRLDYAVGCGKYTHHASCGFCEKKCYSVELKCSFLELCASCINKYLKTLQGWLFEHWTDGVEDRCGVRQFRQAVRCGGFSSRREALEYMDKSLGKSHDVKACRIASPRPDGTWEVFAFSTVHRVAQHFISYAEDDGEGGAKKLEYEEAFRDLEKEDLIRLVLDALSRRQSTILALLEDNETKLAAEILDALYCSHRVTGTKDGSPWPTNDQLAEWSKEKAAALAKEDEDDVEKCDGYCPDEAGFVHRYVHEQTGWSIVSLDRFPLNPLDVVFRHRVDKLVGRNTTRIVKPYEMARAIE